VPGTSEGLDGGGGGEQRGPASAATELARLRRPGEHVVDLGERCGQCLVELAGVVENLVLLAGKAGLLLALRCRRRLPDLNRFATERCGFGKRQATVRVNDGDPGSELPMWLSA